MSSICSICSCCRSLGSCQAQSEAFWVEYPSRNHSAWMKSDLSYSWVHSLVLLSFSRHPLISASYCRLLDGLIQRNLLFWSMINHSSRLKYSRMLLSSSSFDFDYCFDCSSERSLFLLSRLLVYYVSATSKGGSSIHSLILYLPSRWCIVPCFYLHIAWNYCF